VKRDAIQLVRSIYRANKAKDKVVYLEAFLEDKRIPSPRSILPNFKNLLTFAKKSRR